MEYTAQQESPDDFHLWTACTILAGVLGRKCFLNRGFYQIYPNLFTLLVAGSAKCRKSTAIDIGIPFLEDIPGLLPERKGVLIVDGKITPERFIRKIAAESFHDPSDLRRKAPSIFVHADELSVFLTKQSYGEPLIHILTRLFSCPDRFPYETESKGIAELHDVFICILAATTPDGVAKGIPESALQEGFASRLIVVFADRSTRSNAFPELSARELELRRCLRAIILDRATVRGEFTLSPEAKEWFINWYDTVYRNEEPMDHRLAGMHGRKHDHILRVAMLWAGSFRRKEIYIGDLEAALAMVEKIEATAPRAFFEMGGDDNTIHLNRMMAIMKRFRIIDHSSLLRKMYPCTADRVRLLIETGIQGGWLTRDPTKSNFYIFKEGTE